MLIPFWSSQQYSSDVAACQWHAGDKAPLPTFFKSLAQPLESNKLGSIAIRLRGVEAVSLFELTRTVA